MVFEKLLEDISCDLQCHQTAERYAHILGVRDVVCALAASYDLDLQKVTLAALLHDSAKHLSVEELVQECDAHRIVLDDYERQSHSLLHGKVAYIYAQTRYNIHDDEILLPILYHTTGREAMSIYEKLLFIADYCEPGRKLEQAELLLVMARKYYDQALCQVVKLKIIELIHKNVPIHHRTLNLYHSCLRRVH